MARRANTEGPHPIDVYVGARLKARRVMMGISQEKLAEMTDITFQQVQKRESGKNRMGASALHQSAQALGVPVSYFFEGTEQAAGEVLEPVYTSKPSMEVARLVYRMDALAVQFLIQMLRRIVAPQTVG